MAEAPHLEQKAGSIDNPLHHERHQEGGGQEQGSHQFQAREPQKEKGVIDKLEEVIKKDKQEFKDYIKEDEKLEREGNEYGGLM